MSPQLYRKNWLLNEVMPGFDTEALRVKPSISRGATVAAPGNGCIQYGSTNRSATASVVSLKLGFLCDQRSEGDAFTVRLGDGTALTTHTLSDAAVRQRKVLSQSKLLGSSSPTRRVTTSASKRGAPYPLQVRRVSRPSSIGPLQKIDRNGSTIDAAAVAATAREMHDIAGVAGEGLMSAVGRSVGHFCRIGFRPSILISTRDGPKKSSWTMKRVRGKIQAWLGREPTPQRGGRVDDYHERVRRVIQNSPHRMMGPDAPIKLGDESQASARWKTS